MEDGRLRRSTEHHVQLGEAEDEALRLVDGEDFEGSPELVGQRRGQFEATETSAQYQYLYVSVLSERWPLRATHVTADHGLDQVLLG
jgi:hypothetical protein